MEHEVEEMSLIDMTNSLKVFLAEFKKKWLTVCIIVFITSLMGVIYSFIKKPKFTAVSTMMLESSKEGGSMSGALALASQFGLMSGSSSSVINEDKLVEIIKAETIIKTTLFKKVTIDSTTDILANHFIDLFGYKKVWEKDESLKGFRFVNTRDNLTLKENGVLKMFCTQISLNSLTAEKAKSGIITIATTTESESFSKYFNQYLVEALTSFYVDHITEKGRKNVDITQKRVDSVAIALKNSEFTLAKWKDASNQLVKAQGLIEEMRLRRNVEVCNSIYIEGIKQLEMSKFNLLQQTPFLQIIDTPSLPLDPMGIVSPAKGAVMGFIVGGILSVLFVFVEKKYMSLKLEVPFPKKQV